MSGQVLPRRRLLADFATGLGGVAIASLFGRERLLADSLGKPEFDGGIHHRARVKRVIQLFMNGGASQCDMFDYKPALEKYHGKKFDPGAGKRVEATVSEPGAVMKSPFTWARHGQSGRWVSSVLTHTAKIVDKLTFLMAMTSSSNVHGPAAYLQNSGFALPGFPCMGAWISYGLGSLRDDVPSFVVLPDSRGLPYNGRSAFTSGFLPANHQGMVVNTAANEPVSHIKPPASAKHVTPKSQADAVALLHEMNAEHAAARTGDSRLQARIESYELAARLQTKAPELLDLAGESEATKKLYGLDQPETASFGRNCLTARRMIERGVRFVQVHCGHGGGAANWDNHADIAKELPFIARQMDQPTFALFHDLKSRGLLADTLLIWTTEFGRMPFSQASVGRDHNGGTFVSWFAGAGVKPGIAHGESDEWSWQAVKNATTCYDFHATILHLLGIDHEKLAVYHNGIQRRLTDVHGKVVREILA